MACAQCGMPCEGSMCQPCERADHQEDYYGVVDEPEDLEEWTVTQQGLDGKSHEGQATLDGGVAKDGGDR